MYTLVDKPIAAAFTKRMQLKSCSFWVQLVLQEAMVPVLQEAKVPVLQWSLRGFRSDHCNTGIWPLQLMSAHVHDSCKDLPIGRPTEA